MSCRRFVTKLLAVACLLFAQQGLATGLNLDATFGPFIGGGTDSSGATVRQVTGYSAAVDRPFALSDSLSIGPRVEFTNALLNMKQASGNQSMIAAYDNRIFSAGARVGYHPWSADRELYLTLTAGRAFSKVSIDQKTETTFLQDNFSDIDGNHFESQIGLRTLLAENVSLDFAVLAGLTKLDQSRAHGTAEGTEVRDGGTFPLTKTYNESETGLDDSVMQKVIAAGIAIAVGF